MPHEHHPVLPALERMQPGDHYCGIYRNDADHRRIIVDFIRLGIERNEKMIYLVNLQTSEQLKSTLSSAGIDTNALIEKGQLVIVAAKEVYLLEGVFQPQKMIDIVRQETASALAAGYSALRVTGEMTWALAGEPGSERLVEYEALLNQFYAENPKSYSICQYDQRRFDAEMLLDVVHTHPCVLLDTNGFDNSKMYYVPTSAFLTADRPNGILETWLGNLSERPALAQS